MVKPEDAHLLENNPELLHVGIVGGRLWLSEDALDEIEMLTGQRIDSDEPRVVIEFLRRECRQLQARDERLGDADARRNFLAFCALKGIEHAVETRYLGTDHVGAFRPEGLVADFFRASQQTSLALN